MVEGEVDDYRGVWYSCGTANVLPGKKYVYSGPMASYSAWHRPMAVYAAEVRKTFFVYGNPENAPAIGYYDHKEKAFSRPVILGSNPDMDAHRNPTIQIDEDGYIYVFYGAHGHPTKTLRSAKPFDISTWDTRADISDPKTSYPEPFQLLPGEMFVSYRQDPGWRCRWSSDGAKTWSDPLDVVAFEGCAIYAMTIGDMGTYPRAVHLVWSRLGGGTEEEIRTKHLWARRYHLYYARSEDGGRTWLRSDGTPYELPITEDSAEKLYDCGERGVWLKDIQVDAQGSPNVLFLDGDPHTYVSQWKLARFTGGGWQFSDIAESDHMYDDGALVILAEDDFRVYGPVTASQPVEDGGEIEVYQSRDKGRTWEHTASLTSGSEYSHNNVKGVFNPGADSGEFRMFWSYGDSLWPAASEEVRMFYYGENMKGPEMIR
ncbi:MAG: BNR-4 repeat-containing protein [bacterium]|nr:BNR-4 repeat-containing protein [bacterium]